MFPSPETAIENVCRLIDDGSEVFGIGTGAPCGREQNLRSVDRCSRAQKTPRQDSMGALALGGE
jgi:hypothetical protein